MLKKLARDASAFKNGTYPSPVTWHVRGSSLESNMRVFISYKWEGLHHNRWVERLAGDLRARGIDALLDKWEVKLGQSFSDYMTEAISSVDAVLFIMTPASLDSAEAASDRGGAVKFEVQLAIARKIAGERFRFIGILRKGERPVRHLRDNRYLDFRSRKRYSRMIDELVADLSGQSNKPPLPRKFAVHKAGELGADLGATRLRAAFFAASEDIVVWEESANESDRSPVVVYEKRAGKYEPRPIDLVQYATRIAVDANNRIVVTQEREGITVLDSRAVVGRLPIAATAGDPTIRSEPVHPRAPVVAIGTDYGQVIAWDYDKDQIKFARRYFPRKDIVWINDLAIDDVANELFFCVSNVLHRIRLDDGELLGKNTIGAPQETGAIAIHRGLDLLAIGALVNASVHRLSTLEFLYEIRIGSPMVSQLTFSADGKWLGVVFGMGLGGGGSLLVETASGEVIAKFNEISFHDLQSPKQLFAVPARSISVSSDRRLVGVGEGARVALYQLGQ
jgi:TIR domain